MSLCVSLACLALAAVAPVGDRAGGSVSTGVDLALVLAVDVSSSMNESEMRAQRTGYVQAFGNRDVLSAIASGPRGRIAVAYMEWAGPGHQAVRVAWTVVAGPVDAERFAERVATAPASIEPATSISAALAFSATLLALAPPADRVVIDISGDGPNNAGPVVEPVRAGLIEDGVTINGLAITLPRSAAPDLADGFGDGFVRAYYEDCVIGGPGAFVIAVDHASRFEEAILEKLVLEIAWRPPRAIPAGYRPASRAAVDCSTTGVTPGR